MKKNFMKTVWIGACALVCGLGAVACGEKEESSNNGSGGSDITITLNERNITLDIDQVFDLDATVTGTTESVVWSSENTSVAMVDGEGRVTAIADGQTKVFATIGNDRASCTVNVEEGLLGLPSMTVDYKTLTIYVGYTSTVDGVFRIGNEEQNIDKSNIAWSSSNEAVATVQNGAITGVKSGKADITAEYTHDGKIYADTVTVTVKELAVYLVDVENASIATTKTYGGQENTQNTSTKLNVSLLNKDGDTSLVDWSELTAIVEDESIATVSDEGVITAGEKAGKTVVTVKDALGLVISEIDVQTYTAISSKYDLDMLALAYARGVSATDWSKDSKYVLTQDIDYSGDIFIPIAASAKYANYTLVGNQWIDVLGNGEKYGISYAEFVRTGLNGIWPNNGSVISALPSAYVFNATLDGNGYAVKNAKLMLDAMVVALPNFEVHFGIATNFIGYFGPNGALRNISLENVTMQTWTEAGYSPSAWPTLPMVGTTVTENNGAYTYGETKTVATETKYPMNDVGLFGTVAGELENVYAEWNVTLNYGYMNVHQPMRRFGLWVAGARISDCIFVDNFGYTEDTTFSHGKYSMYGVAILDASVTTDNVIVLSGNSINGVLPIDTTVYVDNADLQEAYDADNELFYRYEDWTISMKDGVLTANLK